MGSNLLYQNDSGDTLPAGSIFSSALKPPPRPSQIEQNGPRIQPNCSQVPPSCSAHHVQNFNPNKATVPQQLTSNKANVQQFTPNKASTQPFSQALFPPDNAGFTPSSSQYCPPPSPLWNALRWWGIGLRELGMTFFNFCQLTVFVNRQFKSTSCLKLLKF